jgi:uncharacterized protein (DUF1684 family)
MTRMNDQRLRYGARLGMAAALLLAGGTMAEDPQRADWEAWKATRVARLTAPRGWLSVVGLAWLEPGENRIRDLPGVFVLKAGRVELVASPADGYAIEGKPVERRTLASDAAATPDLLTLGTSRFVQVLDRGQRRALRIWDADAPRRREFAGIETFPFDPAWRFVARWEAYPEPRRVTVVNVLGAEEEERAPGRAWFTIGGKELSLEPTLDDGKLFFVFRDATAGKETYGASRFLLADPPEGGHVVLDFNRAYTPPCGFTPFATCPLPRRENVLPVRVTAGERFTAGH